jgi:hypothetical protein
MTFQTVGQLKPDNELLTIFPDGFVPIVSIFPTRISGADDRSIFYMLNHAACTDQQIQALAHSLFLKHEDCESIESAIAYIKTGLPINCNHFSSVSSNNPAILHGLMDDMGFDRQSPDEIESDREICEYCDGVGDIEELCSECPVCGGDGYV